MKKTELPDYPVKTAFKDIYPILDKGHALALEAPTGSGKTTLLPILILQAEKSCRKILLTQPRRLAAKSVAARISDLLGSKLGDRVGYRVKGESRISDSTVIEVVTEGYALSMLQTDPFLSDYSWIIIDEFHERHIETDLLLTFLRDLRGSIGQEDSPAMVVMTATWQGQPREKLTEFDFHSVEGRLFPVEKIFYKGRNTDSLEQRLNKTVSGAITETKGKILVFLPGRRELNEGRLLITKNYPEAEVSLLYGGMDLQKQQSVIQYDGNLRQIIISTSIAETSLTIEGVTAVIDSGLERLPVYDPGPGLNRLVTRRLSRATSDQRAGRAGRLCPGRYYCLWNESEDQELIERWDPEILCGDLTRARLQTAFWGNTELPWITPPPKGLWTRAEELLCGLEALDDSGKITDAGKIIAGLPLHPRLGQMVMQTANKMDAALAAAILTEGYRYRLTGMTFTGRMDGARSNKELQPIRREASEIMRSIQRTAAQKGLQCSIGGMLSLAYPDRIGRKTSTGEYELTTGASLRCRECGAEWAVFPEVSGPQNRLIGMTAEEISLEEIRRLHPRSISIRRNVEYISGSGRFKLSRTEVLGKIIIKELPADTVTAQERLSSLKAVVKKRGLDALPLDNRIKKHLDKLRLLRSAGIKNLPDTNPDSLADSLEEWLGPWMDGDLDAEKVLNALEDRLDWNQKDRLARLLPAKIELRPGQTKTIDYSNPELPLIRGRMQEFYGLSDMLTIAEGLIELSVELLSPAMRPLQTTSDLDAFWSGSYQQIRSEMRGRYPKHFWPEAPATAKPSLATGKRRPE